MKKIILFSAILLLFPFSNINAQDKDTVFHKNSIGIQYNPYIDNDFFSNSYSKSIIGLKYGYRINNWLMCGSEFSMFTIKADYMKHDSYNLSFYGKATYAKYKIKPFAELNGGLTYYHTYVKLLNSTTSTTLSSGLAKVGFNLGLSFNVYKDIVTFDLYYKFSNEYFINMKKSVLSYKLCVNF